MKLSLSFSQASTFRSFWGEKSELRRFPDGSINEAVLWTEEKGEGEKRNVPRLIIDHVLKRHAHIEGVVLTHNALDSLLSFGKGYVLYDNKLSVV